MINYSLIFYSLFIVSAIIALVYANIIIGYTKGWKTLDNHIPDCCPDLKASVVVACRNEERYIERLLNSLLSQSYPKDKYEIIIVDDFSTDNTVDILNKYKDNITLLHSPSPGKKIAIAHGIENANGELIITTDADCVVPRKWIESHVSLHIEKKTFLQLGLVDFFSENTAQNILTLEFYSLIGSAAGSAAIGKAILSNAANMSFSKKIYLKLKDSINTTIPTGDDIFLLQEIKKQYPDKIAFLKSKECIVKTEPPQNIREFINQRIRWASKNKYYSDKDINFTGLIVFAINLLSFLSLSLALFSIKSLLIFITLLLIKSIVDFNFLLKITHYLNKKELLKYFPIVQLIYPIYIVIVGLLSFFVKYKWKGRKY